MISTPIPTDIRKINIMKILLAAFIFILPMLLGSVHYPVLLVEYIIASIILLLHLYCCKRLEFIRPTIIFSGFILITLTITIFQLIPLPLSLIRILSPKEYELLNNINDIYKDIVEPISYYTISIEPYINLEYLIKIIIFFFLFIIASQREFTESKILLKSIVFSGTLMVFYGFIDALINYKTFYSYNIHLTNEGILPSVFINTNHQAGFLGIATFSGMSLYYSSKTRNEKMLFLFFSILCGAGIFITLSRGGIIAFIASVIMFFVLIYRDRLPTKKPLIILLSIFLTIIIAFYLSYHEIISELATITDMERMQQEKYRLVLNSTGLFKDFLLTGVGKGGFETIYNLYREDISFVSFSQMENQLFQQLADYGIIYFILIIALLIYFIYLFLRNPLSISTSLLFSGLFFIFLQNLVDFNLEIFSIQCAVIVLIATLLSKFFNLRDENDEPVYNEYIIFLSPKRLAIMAVIYTLIFIPSILLVYSNQRDRVEARLDLMLMSGVNTDDNNIKELIHKYPFNYYIPATIAARNYLDTTKPITKAYLLHSSLINPVAFESHYMLYRHYLLIGDLPNAASQCRLALRFARENRMRLIFSELITDIKKSELFKFIPYTPEIITSFSSYLISISELELAKGFIEDALYLADDRREVIKNAFIIYINLKDIPNAEKTLNKYNKIEKGYSYNLLYGILLETKGLMDEALNQYKIADDKNPLNSEIILRIANILKKKGEFEEARSYYIKTFLCDNINTDTKLNIYRNIAETYMIQKNSYEALKYLRTALSLNPRNISIRLQIAQICERNGNLNSALQEYNNIKLIDSEYKDISEKIRKTEERLKEIEDKIKFEQIQK